MKKGEMPKPQKMAVEDVPGVVALHALCFPDQVTTGLGKSFLTKLYRQIATDDRNVAVVIKLSGQSVVQGFAAVTLDQHLEKKLLLRHPLTSLLGMVRGVILSAAVRAGIFRRLKFNKKESESETAHIPNIKSFSNSNPGNGLSAYFLYIAVHPAYRRKGYAENLVKYLEKYASQAGVTRIFGAVYPDNVASLSLYRRLGWHINRTSPARMDIWIDFTKKDIKGNQ